ncbi:MAG: hypothetical protein U5Q44_01350 [Dehalococcoidia bacterium]|nr:hypothetical protein [Dehalococcoidia bacterium]
MAFVVAVPVLVAALWVQFFLLDTDTFADMSDDMLAKQEVRLAVSDAILDQVQASFPGDQQAEVRSAISRAVSAALDTPAFREAFRAAVAGAHEQLADGDSAIRLELENALPVVAAQLPVSVAFLEQQLASYNVPVEITLVQREDRPELWTAFQAVRGGSEAVLAGFLVVAATVVTISPARGQSLAVMGVGGAAFAGGTVFLAPDLSRPLSREREPVLRAGIDAAWETIAFGIQGIGLAMVAVFLVVAVVGVAWHVAASSRPGTWHDPRRARVRQER